MPKTPSVSFKDLIDGQKRLLAQDSTANLAQERMSMAQFRELAKANRALEKIEDHAKHDKIMQAAQVAESLAIKKDDDKIKDEMKKLNKSVDTGLKLKTGDGLNSNIIKLHKTIKDQGGLTKRILDKSRGEKEFKSVFQKLAGLKEGVKDFFTGRGFLDKTGIVKRGTGGVFSNMLDAKEAARNKADARIAAGERARDKDTGKILNAAESKKQFLQDAKKEQELRRKQGDLERQIEKYKEAGLGDRQVENTQASRDLKKLADEIAKLNPMKYADEIDAKGNPVFKNEEQKQREEKTKVEKETDNQKLKPPVAADMTEADIENSRIQNQQLDLLKQIEENTRPGQAGAAKGEGGEGGGLLAGIGKGLTGLGKGMAALGKGAGKGIEGLLKGLAAGAKALANPMVLVGLTAITLAFMGIGKALQWAAPALEAIAPVLMKVAEVIGSVFIEAIKAIPGIITAIGDVIVNIIKAISEGIVNTVNAVTDSIERLSKIDGGNLFKVGAGLLAVASGMAAFAAANVVSGISNIATGLMSAITGQKTPVEQLEQISKFGPNLNQAGTGVKNLASGLAQFSQIDPDKIKAIAALPTEKIAAMGAAMAKANAVYSKSADAKQAGMQQGQSQPVVISAPTTVNKQDNNAFFRSPIRNQESSLNKYYENRYVQ